MDKSGMDKSRRKEIPLPARLLKTLVMTQMLHMVQKYVLLFLLPMR